MNPRHYRQLVTGQISALLSTEHGAVVYPDNVIWANRIHLIPGSFDPLHAGHRTLMQAATALLTDPIEQKRELFLFELSLRRQNKGLLEIAEVEQRIRQFADHKEMVLLTNAPKMVQKAEIFPGVEVFFHVGLDTAARLLEDEGFYGVQGIRAQFYVYPRKNLTLSDLLEGGPCPGNIREGYLATTDYQHLSSTQLRKNSRP